MKTLIFDFDGTIADSFEVLLGMFEQPVKQTFRFLRIKPWQTPWMALKAKRKISRRIDSVNTFEGIPEVIKQLRKDGHQLFILSSNSRQTINRFLKTNNLDDCFDGIYGDIGLRGKSGGLKKVIKKNGLVKTNCVYIGDETRDVEAAKKINISVVAVGWGFSPPEALQKAQPTALARNPKDLLKILSN